MNPYVAWKSYYSVGDPAIDAEHQRLLALINKIYEAVERGDDRDVVKSALNEMLRVRADPLPARRTGHARARLPLLRGALGPARGVSTTSPRLARAGEPRRRARSVAFLKKWWVGHIQSEDKKYMPFLSLAGSRR